VVRSGHRAYSIDEPGDPNSGVASGIVGGIVERIPLHGPKDEILLGEEGFQVYSPSRWKRGPLVRYRDVTHFAATASGLWLGTRSDLMALRRGRFRDRDGPEDFARALTRGIARQPFGLEQLTRIAQARTLSRQPLRQAACRLVAILCIAIYLIQLQDPFIEEVGVLAPDMVAAGQWWRLVTANFLHGVTVVPMHLILNVVGLLALALLVERPLGWLRTGIVLAVSGLFAMGASYLDGYARVMGASGIVMGLAGAALCLELHHCERLPVWWRVPRRTFVALLLIDGALGFMIPFVAGLAHMGGFVGGYLATLLVARRGVTQVSTEPWVRRLAWSLALVVIVSLACLAPLLSRNSAALERYALQLLAVPDSRINSDNELAWRMATESSATVQQLEAAEALAIRAAQRTEHADPDILDTLAEVLYLRGDHEGALRAIDEAIRITRGEHYFVEQRRRFTGERAHDDRPDPPPLPWLLREEMADREFEEPGVVI